MNNCRLKILDYAKGMHVAKMFQFYQQTLNWSRDQIIQYQNDKLNLLLKHAITTVPFYIDYCKEQHLTLQDFKSRDDLKKLPLINRDIIQKNNQQLVSANFKITELGKGGSSGTTGIPINYYYDKKDESAGIGAGTILWAMAGKYPGMKNFYIWGNEHSIERWKTLSSKAKNFLMRQKNVASTLLNEPQYIENVVSQLVQFKPKFIEGYPGAIYTLANYCKKNNISVKGIKAVLCTAENIEDPHRQLIEDVFAPTADLYGSGEVLGVAVRPVNDDKYYILEPHIIMELEKTGIDGFYEVLLTDLDNFAMPFIRYKIGDMVDGIYEPATDAKYPFSYFKKIIGRSADIIYLPNGKMFHPVNIFGGTTFRQFKEITRHKVIWNGKLLKIIFEISNTNRKDEIEKVIEKILAGFQVEYVIEYTDKIMPGKSGKYRYVEIIKE